MMLKQFRNRKVKGEIKEIISCSSVNGRFPDLYLTRKAKMDESWNDLASISVFGMGMHSACDYSSSLEVFENDSLLVFTEQTRYNISAIASYRIGRKTYCSKISMTNLEIEPKIGSRVILTVERGNPENVIQAEQPFWIRGMY